MVRASTLNTLLKYHQSPQSLGAALRQSLEKDAVKPVLLDNQFSAIDRRVSLILQVLLVEFVLHKLKGSKIAISKRKTKKLCEFT